MMYFFYTLLASILIFMTACGDGNSPSTSASSVPSTQNSSSSVDSSSFSSMSSLSSSETYNNSSESQNSSTSVENSSSQSSQSSQSHNSSSSESSSSDTSSVSINNNSSVQADINIMSTSQQLSFNNSGNTVYDGSVKDDGFYQKGVAYQLHRDDDTKIVLDNANNYYWKDDEIILKPWLNENNFLHGNYYDISGDTASSYCESLNNLSKQWRLPTLKELLQISPLGNQNFKLSPTFKLNIDSPLGYWSQTSKENTPILAWRINYATQNSLPIVTGPKNQNAYVRCISGSDSTQTFSRTSEVVTDESTLLMWQDNTTAKFTDWEQAINYCESLTLSNFSDWRLPNINELVSITDFSKNAPSIYDSFSYTATASYWSSTSIPNDYQKSWAINFSNATLEHTQKLSSDEINIRCVRN